MVFRQWRETESPELRSQLIQMHMNLVRYLARKYRDRGEPIEDLVQQGLVGLINAIDRFDPDRGVKFSTYATPTIVGEIRRYFRDKGWSMKVPRRLQELNLRVGKVSESLTVRLDRSPTIAEIARALDASEEEILEAIEVDQSAYALVSLDTEMHTDRDDSPDVLGDHVGVDDDALDELGSRSLIEDAMTILDERERVVIEGVFLRQMSQTQVAELIGVSQMHVSRIQRKALVKMRDYVASQE